MADHDPEEDHVKAVADSIRKIIDDPAASEDVAQLVGAAMGDEPTGHVEAEPIDPVKTMSVSASFE